MFRRELNALWVAIIFSSVIHADAPRFALKKGDVLKYHLVQTTKILETCLDEKTNKPVSNEHFSKVDLVRQWKITEVDEKGIATIEMSILKMLLEQQSPGQEKDVFDSSKPDDLNKNEMSKLVGPVLAVLRVDNRGQLIEVKESKTVSKSRFANELPFRVLLPDSAVEKGATWQRSYVIQIDPPQGTGEKYTVKQLYSKLDPKESLTTYSLKTGFENLPDVANDQIPLLSMMHEGFVYVHEPAGIYYAARLKVEKEVKNHQGEGSSYKYASSLSEDFIPEK